MAEYQNFPAQPAPRASKPAYRVPSFRQIDALPWNGYRVASAFAGIGGSSLGYRMAGYYVYWANEFNTQANREMYKLNNPITLLDPRDIRKISASSIQETLSNIPIDVFDSFLPVISGNSFDKLGLSWETVRLIRELQPRTFIANISGRALSRRYRGVARLILDLFDHLKKAGYEVATKLLDASWYGVPQPWQRIIFIGVRRDLARRYGVKPLHPFPLPYQYVIRDALTDYDASRPLTLAEQKKICSFPDDYALSGAIPIEEQYRCLTRAFPPVLMSHIAKNVQIEILDKCR